MPAGINHQAIREYLEQTWGLGLSRQGAIFLFAITAEPSSRITSVEGAKEYFDSIVNRYSVCFGISLGKAINGGGPQVSTTIIDSTHFDALRKDQYEMISKQFKLLAKYLKVDPSNSDRVVELESFQKDFQDKLDLWSSEFGEELESGIKPCFDSRKGRRFNSSWNIVRQDVLRLFYDAEMGRVSHNRRTLERKFHHIANRSDESVLELVRSLAELALENNGPPNGFLSIGKMLDTTITSTLHQPPMFKFISQITAPQTIISDEGVIEYMEIVRAGIESPTSYPDLLRRGKLIPGSNVRVPYIHVKRREDSEWKYEPGMTEIVINSISEGVASGISFSGKSILVTGAGPGSIGAAVVQGLLMGGARVIVTTSRSPSSTLKFYQQLFSENGSRGSELVLLPFNQGSSRDCEALIDHIYSDTGLNRDLDAIIPFAAISETGKEIDELGAKSELAHRMMMVNVLRLLGRIVKNKQVRQINTRPTQVILPFSPNHGTFGGDGLYSESKLGLEALLNRFHSESWSECLIICGAVIGWTRGTGLMNGNNIVAQAIEAHGVLTFSRKEMAFNILALLTPPVVELCETEPLWADLNGGLHLLTGLKSLMAKARSDINSAVEIRKAIRVEDVKEQAFMAENPIHMSPTLSVDKAKVKPRSTLQIGFPSLPDYDKALVPLEHLQGMVDPGSTIVIVGFSELGPWGSSRTRWQMEHMGEFSQDGYIEMAWIMGLIKHFDGEENGMHYVGWVDAKTGEHVHDSEMAEKYGCQVLKHSGIRLVDPDLFGGYDPNRKEYLQEVAIEEDLPEFDATLATAEAFKLRHGDKVAIRQAGNSDEYKVQIKRGAHILVPKTLPSDGVVAGQIPSGWNPIKYGIPEDIIAQVDPVTLYALCCAAETLYSAGIVDSLEIFKYIHLSELGNFIGSSAGGATKTRNMYKDRYLDKQVQGDVIQETYINTPAAWINMLLLGSAGPIKTPAGACATGIESLDSGCESILSGKTKMCFIGGTDDFQEDESYAFGTMKATVNANEEFAKGRLPYEMSRPTAETRAGFVESQGCGVQLICSAELAMEMGLPIYGVIASSTMAADMISRSLPAPGQGVLSFARETPEASFSPLLSIDYRREQMKSSITGIQHWYTRSLQKLRGEGTFTPSSMDSDEMSKSQGPSTANIASTLESAAIAHIKTTKKLWGNEFRRQSPDISPLRAALAVYGLTINDIEIASLHATSTKANDKNEPEVINKEMLHLGRTPGRPIMAICQKSLTGHPKAPAAAFMLNGALQSLNSGIVPGNRTADNVDETLRKFEHLVFPTETIHTGRELKAFLLSSFGFGQKGGQVVGIASRYFFATLKKSEYEAYASRVTERKRIANRAYIQAMLTNSIFKAKTSPPYHSHDETKLLMDPLARISENAQKKELRFDSTNFHPVLPTNNVLTPLNDLFIESSSNSIPTLLDAASFSKAWIEQQIQHLPESAISVGVDVEELQEFSSDNSVFIDRNYTDAEKTIAAASPDPHAFLAGRWSAKEAVFKSLGVRSQGAGAPLKDIEILSNSGIPHVKVRSIVCILNSTIC